MFLKLSDLHRITQDLRFKMKLESFTASLRGALSEGSKILTDKNDQEFKTSLERWSDLDLQVPAAIVKPISEADTVVIVQPHF